jgi:hypothetical protein
MTGINQGAGGSLSGLGDCGPAPPTDDRRKSALRSKADPSRISETGACSFCEDDRKVYEFGTQVEGHPRVGEILETP